MNLTLENAKGKEKENTSNIGWLCWVNLDPIGFALIEMSAFLSEEVTVQGDIK